MTAPTTYTPPLDKITTAVLTFLRDGGRTVYDALYSGDPTKPAYPYHILYRIAGGSADPFPDLAMNLRSVTLVYQVTSVSSLRNQCENAAAGVRDRLFTRAHDGWANPIPLPAGWVESGRAPDPVMPGIDQSGNQPTVIYSQAQRFTLTITPS